MLSPQPMKSKGAIMERSYEQIDIQKAKPVPRFTSLNISVICRRRGLCTQASKQASSSFGRFKQASKHRTPYQASMALACLWTALTAFEPPATCICDLPYPHQMSASDSMARLKLQVSGSYRFLCVFDVSVEPRHRLPSRRIAISRILPPVVP
jgi:hypothetical protein